MRKPKPAPVVPQKPSGFVTLPFVRYVRACDGILWPDFSPGYRQQRPAPGRPTEWGRRRAR